MLQIRNREPLTGYNASRPPAMLPRDLLASLKSLARRRFGIMAVIFIVSVMCGVIYLAIAPPKFYAQAELLIDTSKAHLFQQQQSVVGDATVELDGS